MELRCLIQTNLAALGGLALAWLAAIACSSSTTAVLCHRMPRSSKHLASPSPGLPAWLATLAPPLCCAPSGCKPQEEQRRPPAETGRAGGPFSLDEPRSQQLHAEEFPECNERLESTSKWLGGGMPNQMLFATAPFGQGNSPKLQSWRAQCRCKTGTRPGRLLTCI